MQSLILNSGFAFVTVTNPIVSFSDCVGFCGGAAKLLEGAVNVSLCGTSAFAASFCEDDLYNECHRIRQQWLAENYKQ